ncbi:uncharacterized protein LOC116169125 [Photinus pyralis]|nr:uncharacterized protein LOC116169125 [Photinus pyralis]
MICAKSERDLQMNLGAWKEELEKRNMRINCNKTKVMVIGKENRSMDIEIGSDKIEQVDVYKYLGVLIHRDGSMDAEVQDRISSAARLYHALRNKFISKREVSDKTKMTVYKTIYRPILTFGSETWNITSAIKSKVQVMEMKFLRRIKGITRYDRIRNDTIREELGVETVIQTIETQQLRWFGHLNRMDDNIPVKRIWEAKGQGRRGRGRPKRTWNQQVEAVLDTRGKTWMEAKTLSRNKTLWKMLLKERYPQPQE